MKKYELTDEILELEYMTLYRIRALRDFGKVKAGELGGFVESEANLSHEGNAWIGGDARVMDKAIVRDDALVRGCASVSFNAEVFDKALVCGDAIVTWRTRIYGNAEVRDNAQVSGSAEIFEYAQIFGKASVSGSARVCGTSQVFEQARICENAFVGEDADVGSSACIFDDAQILGEVCFEVPARIGKGARIETESDFSFFQVPSSAGPACVTAYRFEGKDVYCTLWGFGGNASELRNFAAKHEINKATLSAFLNAAFAQLGITENNHYSLNSRRRVR